MADKKDKGKDAQALPEGQAENPKKKSKLKLIVIILVILSITLSGGLGAYWWFFLRTPVTPAAGADGGAVEQAPEAKAGEKADGKKESAESGQGSPRIERQSDLPRSNGVVVPLPPITVNLADPAGRRYLKLGMEVEANSDISEALKAQNARIRDAVIMLLAGKTYADVASPDGKVLFKAEVAGRINQILGAQRIVRVYLTDFVVE